MQDSVLSKLHLLILLYAEYLRDNEDTNIDSRPLEGESLRDVRARITRFLEPLKNKFEYDRVLIVTHASIITNALDLLKGNNVEYFPKVNKIPKHNILYEARAK